MNTRLHRRSAIDATASSGVRTGQTITDNLQRLFEARATPKQVAQDMQRDVTRLLPRAS
jgi:hypothetical protein